MNVQHKELAAGRRESFSLCEQMAHIGSEVSRACNWRQKGNDAFTKQAINRALELLDMSIATIHEYPRLKELLRVREGLTDYFYGDNLFASSETAWQKYFLAFAYAARKNR